MLDMNSLCHYTLSGDVETHHQKPALFMVHGIGSRAVAWQPIIQQLESAFTCISYDLRGHGQSIFDRQSGLDDFDLDDLVDDIENIRQHLDIKKIHIIGHSLGGMIAPAYALKYPDKILSIGLLSTAAFRTTDDKEKVLAVVKAMREQGVEAVIGTLVNRWFTDNFAADNPDIINHRIKQVLDTDEQVFLKVFDIYANTEMAPWLHKVDIPAIVITGEHDGGCNPRLNRLIDEALPNSELIILDELKHAILIEAPDRVSDQLIQFYASL